MTKTPAHGGSDSPPPALPGRRSYSNHFHNGFHFDDGHSISDNPAIRSLGNLPQILVDAFDLQRRFP